VPVSVYDKKYLIRVLGYQLDDKRLEHDINALGLNVKRVDAREVEVEYNANRPDVISAVGLARALKYFARKRRSFVFKVLPAEKNFEITVGAEAAKVRPFIAALAVNGLKLDEDALKDMISFTDKLSETYGRKRAKIAIGLHDLRNVAPPFTYDAFGDEEFVPLNRTSKMRYSAVLEKEEKGRAYGALLGTSARRYVALKDTKGTMALVPIINSERTRVTRATKDMIIDITGSSKFVLEKVADMLAANFIDMGCEVHQVAVSYGKRRYLLPAMKAWTISVPVDQMEREIGVKIGFGNVVVLGNKMGYEAAGLGKGVRFAVPAYRLDVINDQDVIEDVAIAYGYDYIRPAALPAMSAGSLEERSKYLESVSDAMVGLGFSEELGSYLTNEDVNFKRMLTRPAGAITLANPKTSVATMFRTWLVPSLLRDIAASMHDGLPQRIFEADMAFEMDGKKPVEKYHLAAAVCDAKVNFNDMKAIFEAFARAMRLECTVEKGSHASFIEGRCANVLAGKKRIGFLGEIHPEVLANFGIEEPVLAMEIDLGKIGV
jgi:phenylalanyl-tRNA synthetase beta chain